MYSRWKAGLSAEILNRDYGVSKATLYTWKLKYGGMEINQVKHLRELEEENRKLQQMYAEIALDNKILKDVIEKSYRARASPRAGN